MDTYRFSWRRRGWFSKKRSYKVAGHRYDSAQDKIVIYFPDGSITEICQWNKCEVSLGVDWVEYTKRNLEKITKQPIALDLERKA